MQIDDEPGTLVWVGNRSRPEFVDAFRFCRDHAAQLAVRQNPSELLSRPAGLVKRILFARPDRRPLPPAVHHALSARYSAAQWLALNAALCDGEARTGEPWPSVPQIRFSRWREVLPQWMEPCGYKPRNRFSAGAVLVLCDRYEMAEPYLEIAASRGRTTLWSRNYSRTAMRNVGNVLWDDSLAPPASAEAWKLRLGERGGASVRHVWMVTQPQSEQIAAAIAGGIRCVLTKPVSIAALFA